MRYVIKKFEDDYYKIPVEKESKFDELADLDSQCKNYDLCKPNYLENVFNQYLIEEEDYIVVEKDGVYYHIPEELNNNFNRYVGLFKKKDLMTISYNFELRFGEYIISVK